MYTEEQLDFAYRYPFSEEAKEVVKSLNQKSIERQHVLSGKARVEQALQNDRLEYKETGYGKTDLILSYVYARMLVSALRSSAVIIRYANAESRRAMEALELDSDGSIARLCRELGLRMGKEGDRYRIRFAQYLEDMPDEDGFELPNQALSSGYVQLDRHRMIRVLGTAIRNSIAKGLPVKGESIPKAVSDYAKEIKIPIKQAPFQPKGRGSVSWIDKLLQTPIPDCRHRTVNIILAPYLVNGKGMPVEKATETISNYIVLCKTVNPDTNITDRYIKYQCEYSKKHGLRPLSLKRARVELSAIDFNLLLGEDRLKDEE